MSSTANSSVGSRFPYLGLVLEYARNFLQDPKSSVVTCANSFLDKANPFFDNLLGMKAEAEETNSSIGLRVCRLTRRVANHLGRRVYELSASVLTKVDQLGLKRDWAYDIYSRLSQLREKFEMDPAKVELFRASGLVAYDRMQNRLAEAKQMAVSPIRRHDWVLDKAQHGFNEVAALVSSPLASLQRYRAMEVDVTQENMDLASKKDKPAMEGASDTCQEHHSSVDNIARSTEL